jgi:hypothetical protein
LVNLDFVPNSLEPSFEGLILQDTPFQGAFTHSSPSLATMSFMNYDRTQNPSHFPKDLILVSAGI